MEKCNQMKKVLAISGSTRVDSVNLSLIKAIAKLSAKSLDITIFAGIGNLPQFNPDQDCDPVNKEVSDFREQLKHSDGVIICTPEYAHGVPGSLKNAIDWTISSSSFPNKPTMLITASTGGFHGHKALLETLSAIQASNVEKLQMVIPFVKTKIDKENRITDISTSEAVNRLIGDFISTLNNN